MHHNPVLLKESIEGLAIKSKGIYVDVTYGGGGHSAEILKKLKKGKLIGFEQDSDAFQNNNDELSINIWEKKGDTSFLLCNGNFKYLKNFLNYNGIDKIDGLLADLGVSSYQIDTAERGFSIRFNSELDMRMNKNKKLNAKIIVNEYSEEELRNIFKTYGELDNANEIAKSVVKKRLLNKIETTQDLIDAIETNIPKNREVKSLSKVFQALRIVVNDEIESLKELLLQTIDVINKNGRLVVISYHSLEDRLVKNMMRSGNFEGEIKKDFYGNQLAPFKPVNKSIITPGDEEIRNNNRARSAKLRIAEKI